MSTKIEHNSNSKITYYIDKDKRVVVCKMTDCRFEVYYKLYDMGIVKLPDEKSISPILLKDTYEGKSVCHKSDEWDENTGKRIALDKMLIKYYKDKVNAYDYARVYLKDFHMKLGQYKKLAETSMLRYDSELEFLKGV